MHITSTYIHAYVVTCMHTYIYYIIYACITHIKYIQYCTLMYCTWAYIRTQAPYYASLFHHPHPLHLPVSSSLLALVPCPSTTTTTSSGLPRSCQSDNWAPSSNWRNCFCDDYLDRGNLLCVDDLFWFHTYKGGFICSQHFPNSYLSFDVQ